MWKLVWPVEEPKESRFDGLEMGGRGTKIGSEPVVLVVGIGRVGPLDLKLRMRT